MSEGLGISCTSLDCGPFVPNCSWCCLPSFLAPLWGNRCRAVRRWAKPGSSHSTAGGPPPHFGTHVMCQNSSLECHRRCDFQDCGAMLKSLAFLGSVSTSPTKLGKPEGWKKSDDLSLDLLGFCLLMGFQLRTSHLKSCLWCPNTL